MEFREEIIKRFEFVRQKLGFPLFAKVSWSRVFLCLFLAFSCVSGILFHKEVKQFTQEIEKFANNSGWVRFSSQEGGFSVNFPSDPIVEFKKLDIAKAGKTLDYSEYKSYLDNHVYYSVSYLQLPGRWKLAGSKTLLNGALGVIMENEPGSQLLQKNLNKYKSYPALDFKFKQNQNEILGRLVLVGNTLFKLMVVYPESVGKKLPDHPFLDSFDLEAKTT